MAFFLALDLLFDVFFLEIASDLGCQQLNFDFIYFTILIQSDILSILCVAGHRIAIVDLEDFGV
jgi:hypothetical protein